MKAHQGIAGLALAVLLVGCGNSASVEGRRAELKALLGGWNAPAAAQAPQLTAAAVAASPAPLVEVATATRNTVAVKVAETNGVASFVSADGVTLGLRDRMLVAVRGLHSDVMSSAPPAAARIATASGEYQRSYQILDGLGRLQSSVYSCALAPKGAEEIGIAGRKYATRVVLERCRNATGTFENHYWIDGSGRILQSHQWIGSGEDYLKLAFG